MKHPTPTLGSLVRMLTEKAPTCFLCKWILEGVREAGTLTDGRTWIDGVPMLPIPAKQHHLSTHLKVNALLVFSGIGAGSSPIEKPSLPEDVGYTKEVGNPFP